VTRPILTHRGFAGRRLAAIRRAVDGIGANEVAVYLDEVEIHLNPKIGPDWMNRGKQKEVMTPGQNIKRYVCGALNVRTECIDYVAGERKNGLLFIQTLKRLLETYPHATNGQRPAVAERSQ